MDAIPDFTVLMLSYQIGAVNNRDRYERWWMMHQTPTMLENIIQDMSPASTAVESGFQAYEDRGSVAEFEDFLNQLVSAYVGKQKFIDEAKTAGTLSELQHAKASSLIARHITAIVAKGAGTLSKDGAVLSFSQVSRLKVSLPQVDVFDPKDDASDNMKAEETMNLVPNVNTEGFEDDGVNIPNPLLIQALFPMLVEDVLLQFSRMFYSAGSSPAILEAIASYNNKAQAQADKMFEDMKALRVTKTDLLELLTAKNIGYAAQRKFFKHLLIQKDITKAAFNCYIETVDATEQELMDSAFKNLATLNLRLSFDENARMVIDPMVPTK
jgi:hypothetical protein